MISAIIVNYRLADLALRAVASLLQSNLPATELEIWLVDNSEDAAEAEKLRAAASCRLLVSERNLGFGAACNWAYQQARGEWILLINPDAYLLDDALPRMLRFLQENPRAGAVGPLTYWDDSRQFLLPPSHSQAPWRTFLTQPGGRMRGGLTWLYSLQQRNRSIRYWQARQAMRCDWLSGGLALLRRQALEQAGGLFDPRFFLYYEDSDLFMRLSRAGWELQMLPQAQAVHGFDRSGREQLGWKRQQMQIAHQAFMAKHYNHAWARWLAEPAPAAPWLPAIQDLGQRSDPPRFEVPPAWRGGWLLELSLSPYFLPAVGGFGQGESAAYPPGCAEILPPGRHYVRLGPARPAWLPPRIWQWETAF